MKMIHQLLRFQSMVQWERQRWSFMLVVVIYFVAFFFATTRLVDIVTGFNNQQRSLPLKSRSTRDCFTKVSLWSAKTRRRTFLIFQPTRPPQLRPLHMHHSENTANSTSTSSGTTSPNATTLRSTTIYDLGVGKHPPLSSNSVGTTNISNLSSSVVNSQRLNNNSSVHADNQIVENSEDSVSEANNSALMNARLIGMNWMVPESVVKPSHMMNNTTATSIIYNEVQRQQQYLEQNTNNAEKKSRRMVARDNEGQVLRGALWDEQHFDLRGNNRNVGKVIDRDDVNGIKPSTQEQMFTESNNNNKSRNNAQPAHPYNYEPPYPKAFYPDIDLSIPDSVYSDDVDLVWDLLRYEAYQNQQEQYEPLLVSFLHSTILNHDTLESSLAFLLANRLQSPAMMISTQLQALILSALQDCAEFRRKLRADIMAVRDRDPACHTLPDVFLYFKGFHALQSYRTAHVLWNSGQTILAQYLQSQVSQIFQIDIHPNATIGSGIMLDHGTGIVIGETATVGHNCSILHHVTLGGSGKKGIRRHPAVGNGVLLGAGATVLGPITIGDGCQVGAGTLVISDLPSHCVAVGVPARIIGSFVDVTEQPSIGMDQIMESRDKIITFASDGI